MSLPYHQLEEVLQNKASYLSCALSKLNIEVIFSANGKESISLAQLKYPSTTLVTFTKEDKKPNTISWQNVDDDYLVHAEIVSLEYTSDAYIKLQKLLSDYGFTPEVKPPPPTILTSIKI